MHVRFDSINQGMESLFGISGPQRMLVQGNIGDSPVMRKDPVPVKRVSFEGMAVFRAYFSSRCITSMRDNNRA